ncbi:fibronectin type III domain-containing protein [bacterium]|nr:fibronectin type III domain-containing protein [bacterium]
MTGKILGRLTTLLAGAALFVLASCGGSGGGLDSLDTAASESWPVHGYQDAARSGSFMVVAVDDTERSIVEPTSRLSLEVEAGDGGQYVRVFGSGLEPSNHAYLHLAYDPASVRPVTAGAGREIAGDSMFVSVTSEPGLVAMGIGTIGGREVIAGEVELAEVFFADGPALMLGRGTSAVAQSPVNTLRWDGIDPNKLLWNYRNTGDYDQNRQVGISDITPIGIYLGKSNTESDWFKAEPTDGDNNGVINISDITPIGVNYNNQVSQYRIDSAASESGSFSGTGSSVDYEQHIKPTGGGFYSFEFSLSPAPADGMWFAVTALDNGNPASAHSNAVQFGGSGGGGSAPQNLSGVVNGANFELSWQAPATGTPDGYNAYVSSTAGMSGALKLNSALISGTNYIVPSTISTGGTWYFAVTAMSGTDESSYSNIWTNAVGGDTDPPAWTGTDIGIKAATPGDASVNVEWYTATDTSVPVTYNVYYAETGTGINWNTPQLTGQSGTSAMVNGLTNGTSYDFGVRAVDSASNVTTNENFLSATPAAGTDNTPPAWFQGDGIKSAEPDNQTVSVSWYSAVDASNPPVSYLLYYVEDTEDFDWDNPQEVFDSSVTSSNVIGLTNDQRYKFAVKAQDSAIPPNRTTNENFLYATPQIFPGSGQIGGVTASDTASVRMPGEEVPRIFSVDRGTALNYTTWTGSAWTTLDLNTILSNPDRKYHPQAVARGNDIHVVFGTPNAIYELHGDKDSDPSTWTLTTIANSGINSIFGIGLDYSATDDYFAVNYATDNAGEKLYYSEREAGGSWTLPTKIADGNPEVWQCDIVINENDGSQWAVGAFGHANSTEDKLKFFYFTRPNRIDGWTGGPTGYGGDVMVVEIDPNSNVPIVVNAEVREIDSGFGIAPVSDAVVYLWNGSSWVQNVLEQGDFSYDLGNLKAETILTGQDPQVVFSPTGKGVALWTNVNYSADLLDLSGQLTGSWRYSQRPDTSWSTPAQMIPNISSSNSVTAGEGYQHCVTCDLGFIDTDEDYNALGQKYAQRNNYVEGTLYYRRQSWN